jgi:hypothetical protein
VDVRLLEKQKEGCSSHIFNTILNFPSVFVIRILNPFSIKLHYSKIAHGRNAATYLKKCDNYCHGVIEKVPLKL